MSSMSSTRSSNSPLTMEEMDEPRKKGSRGGKRSVTHLSKTQLARKRANDREAQRNIRQRTKQHIEELENKVKELEGGQRSVFVERVLRRNKELEAEIEDLRAQVGLQHSTTVSPIPPDLSDDLLISQKPLAWIPEPSSSWHSGSQHVTAMGSCHDSPMSNPPYSSPDARIYPANSPLTSMDYGGEESETSQQLYSPLDMPWEDPIIFGPQHLTKTPPAWKPFQPTFSQPSRFVDLQQARFTDLNGTPSDPTPSTYGQSQPSVYAWQISTKLKPPVTLIDQLMFGAIHSHRHLIITAEMYGEDAVGSSLPPVHLLFNQPGPNKPPTALTEVMARYSAVLSSRGFSKIPEKLSSFMCMYRFIQWQISPTYATYRELHEWQAPRPSQLTIPHPAWMDLPPWGKFRDKIIENQDKYDNDEFHRCYVTNLSVNFPYDPMKALILEDGQIKINPLMESHLADIGNMSMKKEFAEKYPEFRDVCRFDDME